MFAPQELTPEDRAWLKYTFLGALIVSAVGAAIDIGKDELKAAIARHREAKKVVP